MSDKQINRAIAEALHWKRHDNDFCRDLNAMHHAEGHLSRNDRQFMGAVLVTVLNRRPEYVPAWRATARERAEAFLRTLGKWEEVQPC